MMTVFDPIDFEAEGLLAGTAGEARSDRETLLTELADEGMTVEELRAAIRAGRLALLPVERKVTGAERYTLSEIAETAGVARDQLDAYFQALGMVIPEGDDRVNSRADRDAAHRLKSLLDAGLDFETLLEAARVVALTMSQLAAANREMIINAVGNEGTELEIARRFAMAAELLVPLVAPILEHSYRLHLREQIRHSVVGAPEGEEEREPMAIAFADLVDFTRLGERVGPDELGAVSSRLAELSTQVSGGPVRIVKLIGDAVMLASADPGALLEAALALVEAVDQEPEGFPPLRAGLALGPVIASGGDFYGSVVNVASRITGVARPSTVVVTTEVRDGLDGDFEFARFGRKHLKGIDGRVELHRATRLPDPAAEEE